MSSSPISLSSSNAPAAQEPVTVFDALGALACPVSVILGTGLITVRQCLALERHSVLRLAESAGDDLRVIVNGVNIARGEVALVDNSTAIRVTELAPAPPARRTS